MAKRNYGWKPDLPDHRDHRYAVAPPILSALPPKVDLRPKCPPVLDQMALGSCTANAIASAYRYAARASGKPDFAPSRLFVYYNERVMEHTVSIDAGAMIRDGVKSVSKLGVCAESIWPYNISRFAVRPPSVAFTNALKHQALSYQAVAQQLAQMKGCLAAGSPFVLGFSVYESFESEDVAKTGVVPMPGPSETLLGGHAVLAVGYDDTSSRFIVMNSWGTGWAQKGFFTIPYAYLTNPDLADDFWTLKIVE